MSNFTKCMLLMTAIAVLYHLLFSSNNTNYNVTPEVKSENYSVSGKINIKQRKQKANVKPLPSISSFKSFVERTIFSPGRRLVTLNEVSAETASEPELDERPNFTPASRASLMEPPALRLFGTIGQGEVTSALVTVTEQNNVQKLNVGDVVGGWQVVTIERNELQLRCEDRQFTFAIFSPKQDILDNSFRRTAEEIGSADEIVSSHRDQSEK